MAEPKKEIKKEVKKEVKKPSKKPELTQYKITKSNGKVIYRDKKYTDGLKKKRLESKGWKVEEV
jgi:hypothetical protein